MKEANKSKEHELMIGNSADFKHFKLYSDGTLMELRKPDLVDYIHMLYHNWKVTDESCERATALNVKMAKQDGRLIPMKPKYIKGKVDRYGHCPNCGKYVDDNMSYCSDCGQALDWEYNRL